MFDGGLPNGIFYGEAISANGNFGYGLADPLAGSASVSFNFHFGPSDESPSSPHATLTFFLESPGPNEMFPAGLDRF